MRNQVCRRVIVALAVAIALTGLTRQTNVVIANQCAILDPVSDPWLWWLFGCGKSVDPTAGGGGGGAQ